MKVHNNTIFLAFLLLIFCSFTSDYIVITKFQDIQKYEYLALKNNKIGSEYIIDLTGIDGCNKSRVKYLGVVNTSNGKQYKILTSFFVFGTSNVTCHGTSNIKIYDRENRFVGAYYMGMPDELPDTLVNNKLLYFKSNKQCPLLKGASINLSKGLPKSFFLPCSSDGGNMYSFIN